MGRLVTLEELEAYRQEIGHANREGRVPRYRDPREVFNENPNREDGFLVEFTDDELAALEEDRQRAYQDSQDMRAQVIQEIQDNGNVMYSDSVLPASASPDEHNVSTPQMTEEQATQIYDNTLINNNEQPPVGALENPAQSPSVAPDESVVPAPGAIEGAPEPMQSIVEAAALQGNDTGSVHQNLVSTPNPEPSANDNVEQPENVEPVTPATGGDNPATVEELNLPDLHEPTSVPSPTAPADIAGQTAEQQQEGNITDKILDPGNQQFQPAPGENAGPTVPGADNIQTPTLNDEAAVPSEPTNADAVNVVDNPSADSGNANAQPDPGQTGQVGNAQNQTPEGNAPSSSE